MNILKSLRQNWKTGVLGALTIAAAGGATVNGAPLDPNTIMQVLAGIGLIVARDPGRQ